MPSITILLQEYIGNVLTELNLICAFTGINRNSANKIASNDNGVIAFSPKNFYNVRPSIAGDFYSVITRTTEYLVRTASTGDVIIILTPI